MKKIVIHCTKGGMRIEGANNVGSESDTVISSRSQFMRVAEHWWNTYCSDGDELSGSGEQLEAKNVDWNTICSKCADGEIEPQFCEYYREPNGCNSPIYGQHPRTTTGNAAAMREALDAALSVLTKVSCSAYTVEDTIEKIRAALSAPPRNCDVGTAEEQTERFKDLCRKYRCGPGPRANCKGCPIQHESPHVGCTFAWAQMPYESDVK